MSINTSVTPITSTMKVEVATWGSGRHNGVSLRQEGRVITNAPEKVRVVDARPYRSDDSDGVTVTIEVGDLGGDDFVALLTDGVSDDSIRGERKFHGVRHVAGREVELSELYWGYLFRNWAWEVEDQALEFLVLHPLINQRKLVDSVRWGADAVLPYGSAPHAGRRASWGKVLRKLDLPRESARVLRTIDHATVKVALLLGWKPEQPLPKRWEGLKEGVEVVHTVS